MLHIFIIAKTLSLAFFSISGSDVKRTFKLGFLVPFNKGKPCKEVTSFHGEQYAQAIPVAMEKVNSLNYSFNLTWVWNDTMCEESLAIEQQLWQLKNGVDVYVGPVRGCKHTSMNAVATNKPVMSFVS